MSVLRASARLRAADLLAQPRGGGVHLRLPAPALRCCSASVYSDEIDGVPSVDVLLAGLFGYGGCEHGVRRARHHPRRSPGVRSPEAPSLHAASTVDLLAAVLRLDARSCSPSRPSRCLAPRCARFRRQLAGEPARLRGRDRRRAVACFAGMGFGAAALIRSAEGVSAVVNVIVLPMAFLSGSFGPTEDLPAFLQAIGGRAPADVLHRPRRTASTSTATRSSPTRRPSASSPRGAIAGLAIALRGFGWMPRER